MSNFKIAVTAIFSVSIVVGIAMFALSKVSSGGATSNLVVWGTVPADVFDAAYKNSSLSKNKLIKINYVKKEASSFDNEFVEALAESRGPDLVLLRDDFMYKHRNKLLVIPYQNYSQRNFKDQFIQAGEIFLSPDGVVGLPFLVDPLVMYWNRDLFSNSAIATPPQYWDEIPGLIEKMTKRDKTANILQSSIALGEWRNIVNAKEILATLLIQAGTPITTRGEQGLESVLNNMFSLPVAPSTSAVNFYTQFSNPTAQTYTWNRSLPSSLNMFLSGNLGMYIGFSSEIFSIQQKNSNLNFDVTYVPQIRNTTKKVVFGHLYALAIVKQSSQVGGAFVAMTGLTEPSSIRAMEEITNLPPVRRDLLSSKPADAFRVVFYNSALQAGSWIDPNSALSSNTFRDMIESITSGRNRTSEALQRANDELNLMLK